MVTAAASCRRHRPSRAGTRPACPRHSCCSPAWECIPSCAQAGRFASRWLRPRRSPRNGPRRAGSGLCKAHRAGWFTRNWGRSLPVWMRRPHEPAAQRARGRWPATRRGKPTTVRLQPRFPMAWTLMNGPRSPRSALQLASPICDCSQFCSPTLATSSIWVSRWSMCSSVSSRMPSSTSRDT